MTEQTLTIEQIEAALAAAMFPPEPHTPYSDPSATWTYWTDMDSVERGVPDEWVWERLRNQRNLLLSACDFRVLPDNPSDQVAWKAYRKALRDLPKNTVDPRKCVWPVEPNATP